MRFKSFLLFVLFLLILFSGFFLRKYNYYTVPRHGATFDEFAWTWLGINIINTGKPVSWSSQPQYTDKTHLIYQGAAFWIVTPYLEHPPLFGLVAGSFAKLRGVKTMYEVTLQKIRPLGLLMGIISIILVFILTNELYGLRPAYLAALFYATVPTLVIGSRLVQNENFLIPMWLTALYCLRHYLKSKRLIYKIFAITIASLLPLAKIPWVVTSFSIVLILTYHHKWKDAFYTFFFTALFFLLFVLYGFWLDKSLFVSLWKLQMARYDITFSGFFSIFTKPLLVDWYYLDGWIYFGWFSILMLFQDLKKNIFILLPFISYLLMYAFAIPDEPGHGWYRYPFFPFLIIATALYIQSQLNKLTLSFIIFLFITGFSLLQNAWYPMFGFSYLAYRGYIMLSSIPVFFFLWFRNFSYISKIYIYLMVILLVILNILAVRAVIT